MSIRRLDKWVTAGIISPILCVKYGNICGNVIKSIKNKDKGVLA